MLARVVAIAACAVILGAAAPAAGHYGIGKSFWLDDQTALKRLKAQVVKRYVPGAVKITKGRCAGRAPSSMRDGRAVHKHFVCSLVIRLNTMNYSFDYRVHVTSSGSRIVLGGAW